MLVHEKYLEKKICAVLYMRNIWEKKICAVLFVFLVSLFTKAGAGASGHRADTEHRDSLCPSF